jgi:hypothetical protein
MAGTGLGTFAFGAAATGAGAAGATTFAATGAGAAGFDTTDFVMAVFATAGFATAGAAVTGLAVAAIAGATGFAAAGAATTAGATGLAAPAARGFLGAWVGLLAIGRSMFMVQCNIDHAAPDFKGKCCAAAKPFEASAPPPDDYRRDSMNRPLAVFCNCGNRAR